MTPAPRRISHKTIAEALNLSRATVGNILNGRNALAYNAETRERVTQKAKELGYQINRASLAIRTGKSNLIGIVHFGANIESARRAATRLPQAINAHGYDYLVVDLRWHGGNVERVFNEMIQARVEGVIISHMVEAFRVDYVDMLKRVGIPSVTVYGDDRLGIPLFRDDATSAFCAMTRHLQAVGHRHLLLVANANTARTTRERIAGFQSGWNGPRPPVILNEHDFFAGAARQHFSDRTTSAAVVVQVDPARYGYRMTAVNYQFSQRLFKEPAIPQAILCSNDMAAFGLFNAAYEAGLQIPRDVAVTGFDNDPFTSYPMFRLSTIATDIEAACDTAVESLAHFIQGKQDVIANRVFESQLILRSSCGRTVSGGEEEIRQSVPLERHEPQTY